MVIPVIRVGSSPAKSDVTLAAEDVLSAVRKEDVVTVDVPSDPAYGVPHRYRAVSLMKILEDLGRLDSATLDRCDIVFDCEDGYRSVLKGVDGRSGPAYLAISDVNAPVGEDWIAIKKTSGSMVPGPLYLVWTNAIPNDDRPKPYEIIRIEILHGGDSQAAAWPSGDTDAQAGFALFRTHCMSCHSINGVGGKVGVDLNHPVNVTEYWRKPYIKQLIHDPQSIRANARMPAFPQLTGDEIDLVMAYLSDMKSRKAEPLNKLPK